MTDKPQEIIKAVADYTPEELKSELKTAYDKGDMKRVAEISAEMLRRDNADSEEVKLKTEHEELLKKIQDHPEEVSPEQMREFITTDLKYYKSKTDKGINEIKAFKDSKIEELTAQLKEKEDTIAAKDKEIAEKDSVKATLDGLPGLHDLSFETWSLIKVGKHLRDMEEKGTDSKKVLLYCMAVTHRQVLGMRTSTKKLFLKLFKKRKGTSIIKDEEVSKLKTSLQPDPNSKAKFKEALKKVLLSTIEKQQTKYADDISETITGKKVVKAA